MAELVKESAEDKRARGHRESQQRVRRRAPQDGGRVMQQPGLAQRDQHDQRDQQWRPEEHLQHARERLDGAGPIRPSRRVICSGERAVLGGVATTPSTGTIKPRGSRRAVMRRRTLFALTGRPVVSRARAAISSRVRAPSTCSSTR